MKLVWMFTILLAVLAALMDRADARQGCICPQVESPVCGSNGRVYGNSCKASCAGVMVKSGGNCPGQS